MIKAFPSPLDQNAYARATLVIIVPDHVRNMSSKHQDLWLWTFLGKMLLLRLISFHFVNSADGFQVFSDFTQPALFTCNCGRCVQRLKLPKAIDHRTIKIKRSRMVCKTLLVMAATAYLAFVSAQGRDFVAAHPELKSGHSSCVGAAFFSCLL